MAVCVCGHDLGAHPPDPERPFAWPCRVCSCREYREKKEFSNTTKVDRKYE